MPKTNLLVISPPDHYALRNLTPLRDQSELSISNNPDELKRLAPPPRLSSIAGLESKRLILRSFGDT